MQLKYIKEERCVICQAPSVLERQPTRSHSNGGIQEERQFDCGRRLEYSPNFLRVEVIKECPKHPVICEINQKRDTATRLLREFIDQLDVDEAWKTSKRRSL